MHRVGRILKNNINGSNSFRAAFLRGGFCSALIFPLVANCTIVSHQTGPERPFTIAEDVTSIKLLDDQLLSGFYRLAPAAQASARNQIVTARMYVADLEYHYYEANLTRELQTEGLLATAVNLGLTGSASLIPVAQTSRLLAGIATGVTGLDKAYNEKELLNNTIQALQTQMRADRKTQAAIIYAKMLRDDKTITPIAEYTLPMALSDADAYYQAGTIASALIGLSKTLANAEQNADQAKSASGPNPGSVSVAKETASPRISNLGPGSVTKFSALNDLTTRIRTFWRSNKDNKAAVESWLMNNGIDMPVAFFLRSNQTAQQRQMIQDLRIP